LSGVVLISMSGLVGEVGGLLAFVFRGVGGGWLGRAPAFFPVVRIRDDHVMP
jgi:hypothetical protein